MSGLGVIFDMDGVLVDSYQAHLRSWQLAAAERGLTITDRQFAATFGRTSREIIRSLWPDRVPPEEVAAVDARKEELYRQVLEERFPEMDGAGELLVALHAAGFRLAIGSSGPPENVAAVLRHLPHARCITAAVDASEVTRGKPDPEVFLKAAGKIGVAPRGCAVIEDAVAGLEAARRAGMAAVALTGTTPRDRLVREADLVVGSLRALGPDRLAEVIARAGRPVPRRKGRATAPRAADP
jgi:beta-phosphoglucomutase